jgi:hypothetical protein
MSLFIHKIDHGFLDKSHIFVEKSPSKKNEGAYANKFVSRNGPSGYLTLFGPVSSIKRIGIRLSSFTIGCFGWAR